MTPMVATSIVARLGCLACAYFHTSVALLRPVEFNHAVVLAGPNRTETISYILYGNGRSKFSHFLFSHTGISKSNTLFSNAAFEARLP